MAIAAIDTLAADLVTDLRQMLVRAWRLELYTGGAETNVSMLRGVWGMSLRQVSGRLYSEVFSGDGERSPRYLLRPVADAPRHITWFDFLLFGPFDEAALEMIWAAWQLASLQGLGERRRPFDFYARPLARDGTPMGASRYHSGFPMAPLPAFAGWRDRPCRVEADGTLRLLRDDRLITHPTLADLTIAGLRRIRGLGGPNECWLHREDWMAVARSTEASSWQGRREDFRRYSSSQRREVEQRGVAGWLDLPHGPGPLAPLLAAAEWMHLGKGTVMGLGRIRITGCG